MKINLSFPATGCQKLLEIADELKVKDIDRFRWIGRTILQICISQVRPFYEKRMGQEVEADTLGDEFKVTNLDNVATTPKFCWTELPLCYSDYSYLLQGYVLRITGGNDKQGFPMKQVNSFPSILNKIVIYQK